MLAAQGDLLGQDQGPRTAPDQPVFLLIRGALRGWAAAPYGPASPSFQDRFMSFDRRQLLAAAGAAGLIAAAPKPKGPPPAATPGDAALNRYFDGVCEHMLSVSPETATSLGLDTGKHAALKSRLSDASIESKITLTRSSARPFGIFCVSHNTSMRSDFVIVSSSPC